MLIKKMIIITLITMSHHSMMSDKRNTWASLLGNASFMESRWMHPTITIIGGKFFG